MPDQPRISIVVPVFNHSPLVERAVESVLSQGGAEVEIVIAAGSDAGDTDELIRRCGQRATALRVGEGTGVGGALNAALQRCSGDLLGWLDADQRLLPGAFEAFVAAWRQNPKAGAWVGGCRTEDEDGKVLRTTRPASLAPEALADWEANGFCSAACLFSRAAWERCGPADETLQSATDFDLWLRMAREFTLCPVPQDVAVATVRGAARTQEHRSRALIELWRVQVRHGFEEVARSSMKRNLDELIEAEAAFEKFTHLPLYRAIRPVARLLFGRGRHPVPNANPAASS